MLGSSLALLCALSPAPQGAGAERELGARIDGYLRPYLDAGQFAGVVLVARGDEVLFEKAYGAADVRSGAPMRLDTTFRLASLSKTFTGAAVVLLAKREVLTVKDPLVEFLPTFPNAKAITLEQLLLHRSGVGEFEGAEVYERDFTLDELVKRVAAAKPLFVPGARSSYSNEGYVLLATVVEHAADAPFGEFLTREFFTPLGMSHTRLEGGAVSPRRAWGSRAVLGRAPLPVAADEAAVHGASGIESDARDLLAWLRGARRGKPIDLRSLSYPYGWGERTKDGERYLEQSGMVEGFSTYMASYACGYDVVCLSNVQSGMQARLGPDFASVLLGGQPSRPPHVEPRGDAAELAELAGEYVNADIGYPLRLRLADGELAMTWGPFPFWHPLSVVAPDELFVCADYSFLSIRRDAQGRVIGLGLRTTEGDGPAPGKAQEFVRRR